MRILIAIQEIAGYHGQVAEGLRERGHEVTFVRLIANGMGYRDGQRAGFAAAINWWSDFWFRVRSRSVVHKGIWWLGLQILRPVVFVWAVRRFRNFIFVFGRSLLPLNLDLPVLRLLGKRILFVFHGSDSRAAWMDYGGLRNATGTSRLLKQIVGKVRRTRSKLRWIGKYADWIVDNPFSAHLHTRKKILNWFCIGMPVTAHSEGTASPLKPGITALHSPSAPLAKGTLKILEAIEACRQSLPDLNLITISGRPNSEIFDAIRGCDFVVDQLYADTPCAGFVMEAASLGRPAIVGGLGWGLAWLKFSGLKEYPAFVVDPDEIESAIRRMARQRFEVVGCRRRREAGL